MTLFTTSSPKEEILTYLETVSQAVRSAMDAALPETCHLHHSHGLTLEPGKPYDRQYFAYTMRVLAKRNLAEFGIEAEIEEDVSTFKIQSVSLGGLVLKTPGFVIRILKQDANFELPKAASESRALFYDQQIPFPFLEGPANRDLSIVYLWGVNHDFTQLSWHIALPMNRQRDCYWKVRLDKPEMSFGAPESPLPLPSSLPLLRPPLAAIAALADCDLNYTSKTSADEEIKEPRSKAASNGT